MLNGLNAQSSSARGAAAEALAAEYLQARGFRILARNLRSKGGELDLVGLDGQVLAIVEVRQRSRIDFGGPGASVAFGKQRKLVRTARFFLQRRRAWHRYPLRFDVVAVHGLPCGNCRLEWIKDAFRTT